MLEESNASVDQCFNRSNGSVDQCFNRSNASGDKCFNNLMLQQINASII